MVRKKYPIKYALMPVRERVDGHGKKYEIALYIVSKCYVISKIRDYIGDRDSKCSYEVVFSFSIDDNDGISLVLPQYSEKSICVNSIVVDGLFEDFDEALSVAKKKNQEILDKKIDSLPCGSRYQTEQQVALVRKRHKELLDRYKKIEALNELRSDLVISGDTNPQFYEFVRMMVDDPENFYAKVSSSDEKKSLNYYTVGSESNTENQDSHNNLLNVQVSNDRLIAATKQKVLRANRGYSVKKWK